MDTTTAPNAAITPAWLDDLFASIDRRDAQAFVSFLTDDARFRFGNAPAVTGRDAIAEAVAQFFSAIGGLRHEVTACLSSAEVVACRGNVTYTRLDGSTVTLPFADVFEMAQERVSDYQIYMDLAPLWDPPQS